jgi:hypothetical protein
VKPRTNSRHGARTILVGRRTVAQLAQKVGGPWFMLVASVIGEVGLGNREFDHRVPLE